MTHEERRERRKRIAMTVSAGEPVREVAAKFNTPRGRVYAACEEFGVQFPTRAQAKSRTLRIIAMLCKGVSIPVIARRFAVAQRYVLDLKKAAIEADIPIKESDQ